MFHVAKGDDIFMLYDRSKLGLSNSKWALWSVLPAINSMTHWVTVGS